MVLASKIACFLNKKLYGEDVEIQRPAPLSSFSTNTITFARNFSKKTTEVVNTVQGALIIAHDSFEGSIMTSHILSNNPRLDFAYVMKEFFVARTKPNIAATARVGQGVILGKDVSIGEYTIIDDNVTIGDNTVIDSHVRIKENVSIGNDCIIRSHVVIGEQGFGFERNEADIPIRFPHIGGVIIGNNVELGVSNVISAGTLEPTLIGNNTKISGHVYIAHNCSIGEGCIITACAEINGSVKIGKMSWIGPNATIINKITIGENVVVGIGSVVNKSVGNDEVVVGNPAHPLKEQVEMKNFLHDLFLNHKKTNGANCAN